MDRRPAWLILPEGPVPYDVANDAMHRLAEQRFAGEIGDTVILLEHPPVFTAGRRAKDDELLWTQDEVHSRGGYIRRIDRGGSFTFHGPGQVVGYPIVDLGPTPDAARYLRQLEDVAIGVCADVGVTAGRRPDIQTGVWSGEDKICAIGVRLMRTRVALHGFALNCDPDLGWYEGIVACGLPDRGVTSLTRALGRRVGVEEVRPLVVRHLEEVFGLALRPAPDDVIAPFAVTADVA